MFVGDGKMYFSIEPSIFGVDDWEIIGKNYMVGIWDLEIHGKPKGLRTVILSSTWVYIYIYRAGKLYDHEWHSTYGAAQDMATRIHGDHVESSTTRFRATVH